MHIHTGPVVRGPRGEGTIGQFTVVAHFGGGKIIMIKKLNFVCKENINLYK